MSDRILVAYASWAGSTAEVAEAVGLKLENEHVAVDILPFSEVTGLDGYRAVVVGSAIRAGQVHPQMLAFLEAHQNELAQLPVAYFVVCLTMVEDTEENRCTVEGYLDAVKEKVPSVEPVDVGLFAGVMDLQKLPFLMRLLMKLMRSPVGDFRDWEVVRGWAANLRPMLLGQ